MWLYKALYIKVSSLQWVQSGRNHSPVTDGLHLLSLLSALSGTRPGSRVPHYSCTINNTSTEL